MSSAAQDEFNRLNNTQHQASAHPEDRDRDSDRDSTAAASDHDHDAGYAHSGSDDDDDDLHYHSSNMVSRTTAYHIPNTVFDANTGPKGVIADAQAFERARKRSFRRTLFSVTGFDQYQARSGNENSTLLHKNIQPNSSSTSPPQAGSSEDDEDSFMRKWRESRMQELQTRTGRRSSPRRKLFGTMDVVDAGGYLDAVEKSPADCTVVVCIYDPESPTSSIVEDCLATVARKQSSTRFIKLHHEIAEMDHIEAPALLAYRNGDLFATIVDIMNQFPNGRSCSSESLEDLLKLHRVL